MSDFGVLTLLRDQAARDGDAIALLAPGRRPLSYARLLEQVEATVAALRSHGVARGDRVSMVLPNGPEMAAGFLAVASAAVCAPLNPAYRSAEFDFYLSDLNAKILIVQAGMDSPARAVAQQRGIPIVELSPELEREAGVFSLELPPHSPVDVTASSLPGPDDIALLLHTSGTTSRPKMVPLTQRNLWHSAENIRTSLDLGPSDRTLNVMPLFHIHGLIGALLSSLAAGASAVCTGGFEAARFFDWLREFRPTWYTAVPTMHQTVIARAAQMDSPANAAPLRFIRSCSAALPPQVMMQLEQVFGVPVLEAYGMTEATHQMACNPLPPHERKPGSVGVPTGTEVAIMDEAGNLLPPQSMGEIVVRAPNVTSGYLDNPTANGSAFVGGWFRTGDQGIVDAEGYVFIRGRTKEIINRAGEKISPRELEEVLLDHPAVGEVVAFALPDRLLGEDVGAAIVLRRNSSVSEAELRQFAALRLAEFKVPRRIVFLAEIPKGPTGKAQRIGLAARLGLAEPEVPTKSKPAFLAPRTKLEELLSAMWHRILPVERIGVHDNFFDLGGDSRAAVELIGAIEKMTQAQLSVAALMNAPTIDQLAALITGMRDSDQRPRLAAIQPAGSQPPFFSLGAGPLFRDLARHLGPDQPFLALQYLDAHKLPMPYRLEDIAAFHVQTIRAVQPKGPYFIGGWCMGGLIAYETAQQLWAQGEQVDLLVLFDTVNPAFHQKEAKINAMRVATGTMVEKLRLHIGHMRRLGMKEGASYALGRAQTLISRAGALSWELAYKVHLQTGLRLHRGLRDMERIERLAGLQYRPQPYPGRALLLQRSLRPEGRHQDSRYGWGDLIRGGLDIGEIPGDHRDMFLEPGVQITARMLGSSLAESRRQQRPASPRDDKSLMSAGAV